MNMPLTYRNILLFQTVAALGALAAALVAQYVFLLHPCELCLMQRVPYALIIGFGALAAWKYPARYAVLLCALLFAVTAGIAFYHTGVEFDIFAGPDACSAKTGSGQTLEEMRAEIMGAPLVSCKQAMAYIFGLSMAAWNGLAASAFFLMSIVGVLYAKPPAR
jgi:disulfide bond formation protein DsbB